MNRFQTILQYIFLTIVLIFFVFPLLWMLLAATNTSQDVSSGVLTFGNYALQNIKNLLNQAPLFEAMANSFHYAVITTVVSLLLCSLAGYGFEMYHDKAKDKLMGILLMAMMIPFAALIIPLFQMFANMSLLNTTLGFLLPTVATPFLIMLFRQNSRAFPKEIVEAARIDGLGEISIFFKMFMPVMKSTYTSAMTIVFMNSWNNFLWPKIIMTNGESLTMPMLISSLKAGYVTDYGLLMMAVSISTLPTIIVFFILQKSFIGGITGSVKG